jgi:hypothetical protein
MLCFVCGHKYLGFNHKYHEDMANAVHVQSLISRLEVYRTFIILLLNLRKLLKLTFVNVRDGLEIYYITKSPASIVMYITNQTTS